MVAKGRSRGGWTPHRLPRIRCDLVEVHDSAAAEMPALREMARRAGTEPVDDDAVEQLRRSAGQLRAADLYWVTAEMTRVALGASADLPEWTPAAVSPSAHGLLVWDGGLPHLAWKGAPAQAWTTNPLGARVPPTVAVDGVAWAPDPVAGCALTVLTRTERLDDGWLVPRWARSELFPFGRIELRLLEPVPVTSPDWSSGLVAALGATWLLMAQPTIAETRPLHDQHVDGPGRSGRGEREVRIIDLRSTGGRPAEAGSTSDRVYTHRWVVRAHWRQQAVGPGRSQRRPVWVPAHVKGPEGAPMLETEPVHVWRR